MTDQEKIDALRTFAEEAFSLTANLWGCVGQARHVSPITEEYDGFYEQYEAFRTRFSSLLSDTA